MNPQQKPQPQSLPPTSCLHEIKSMKEFRDIVDNHAETLLLNHWTQCPGCQDLRKDVETWCHENNLKFGTTPVAIIGCEVGSNPDCAKIWDEAKPPNMSKEDYGVPAIHLIPNKGLHTKPDATFVGASPERKVEIKSVLAQLKEFAKQVMSQGNASHNTAAPPPSSSIASSLPSVAAHPPPVNNPPSQSYPAQLYHNIAGYIVEKPQKLYQMKANPNYPTKNNMFCVHGVDCDYQTFNAKIQNYLFS